MMESCECRFPMPPGALNCWVWPRSMWPPSTSSPAITSAASTLFCRKSCGPGSRRRWSGESLDPCTGFEFPVSRLLPLKLETRTCSFLPMKVTESDVLHVAELANLELTAEERVRMLKDLNSILEYVDRLNQLDTANVPPMAQVSDRYGVEQAKTGSPLAGALRDDVLHGLRPSLERKQALQNAPASDGAFFQVP